MRPRTASFAGLGALCGGIVRSGGRRSAVALALMAAGAVLEGVGLACFLPLIALVTGVGDSRFRGAFERGFGLIGLHDNGSRLLVMATFFVAVMGVRGMVLGLRDRALARLQLGLVEQQRARLIAAVANARWEDIVRLQHARINNALAVEIARVAIATQLVLQSGVAVAMLLAQWTIALLIAPRLAGTLLAVMLVVGALALRPALRHAWRSGADQGDSHLRMMNTAGQLLGGLKPAIAQNMQAAFITEFAETSHRLTQRQFAYQSRQSMTRQAVTMAAATAGAALLLIGHYQRVPVASLLAALAIFSRMTGPLSGLSQNILQIANNLPAQATLATLHAQLARDVAPVPAMPVDPAGPIALDRVTYRHADGGGVSDITMTLGAGEIVGLVGPSGAGKTTLVDLLTGLLTPQAGTIRVGARAIDDATGPMWRAHVAYVAQEPYLFHDTIRRNLSWGNAVTDDAALWAVLELAGAGDLVRCMEGGLETIVGERGVRLSGGERQRLSLARALLRGPALLILDEATNAVDVATEAAILKRVIAMPRRPTIVLIAHRAETLAVCDRLIALEAGRLVRPAGA